MSGFTEDYFTAPDGVRTWWRRYEAEVESDALPVLCLHGLTRNSRDFAELAPKIAAAGRDVVAIDTRGRGRSDRDPNPANYAYPVYVDDVSGLLDALGWDRVVTVGTSMGGLISMFLAAQRPGLIAGAVINDIGPELDPRGLARITGYVGGSAVFADWDAAAAATRAINGAAFPNETGDVFWQDFARRIGRETETGEVVFDYDPAIAEAFKSAPDAPAPDLWPVFDALAAAPVLLVRGAITDLLSEQTVAAMTARQAHLKVATVPDVGHAPLLTEPEAWSAIEAFLSEID